MCVIFTHAQASQVTIPQQFGIRVDLLMFYDSYVNAVIARGDI